MGEVQQEIGQSPTCIHRLSLLLRKRHCYPVQDDQLQKPERTPGLYNCRVKQLPFGTAPNILPDLPNLPAYQAESGVAGLNNRPDNVAFLQHVAILHCCIFRD
jgi:hypothetical protein